MREGENSFFLEVFMQTLEEALEYLRTAQEETLRAFAVVSKMIEEKNRKQRQIKVITPNFAKKRSRKNAFKCTTEEKR